MMSRVSLRRGQLKAALDHLPSEQAVTISNLNTCVQSVENSGSVVHRTYSVVSLFVASGSPSEKESSPRTLHFGVKGGRNVPAREANVNCDTSVKVILNLHSVLLLKQARLLLRKFTNSGTKRLESRIY